MPVVDGHGLALGVVVIEAQDGRYAHTPMLAAFVHRTVNVVSDDGGFILGLAQPLSTVLGQADRLGIAMLQIVIGLCFVCVLLATLARARRSGERIALLFIDLDKFKDINDQLGHDAGDAVLKEVAARLTATTREMDTVARLGGDEFVVLLNDPAHSEQIATIARKLLDGLRPPIPFRECALPVGASIGISLYPDDGETASEIITSADRAMYETKAAGRNGFRFASLAGAVGRLCTTTPAEISGSAPCMDK